MQPKIDIVITRHAPLVALLSERGLIDELTPVIQHATAGDVAGKHVLGVLPHWLSSKAASVTEIPMHGLTQEDREAMTRGDLSLERTREVAGEAVTYYVTTERQWPVMRVFDRAVRHATAWGTFHVKEIGPGLLRLEASEGTDWADVDLYKDRYRTQCIGSEWSPWLDENGERHERQDAPASEYRLQGRDGFDLAPWVAYLRFADKTQAWAAAEVIFRGHHLAEGPFGVQAIVGPVPV